MNSKIWLDYSNQEIQLGDVVTTSELYFGVISRLNFDGWHLITFSDGSNGKYNKDRLILVRHGDDSIPCKLCGVSIDSTTSHHCERGR